MKRQEAKKIILLLIAAVFCSNMWSQNQREGVHSFLDATVSAGGLLSLKKYPEREMPFLATGYGHGGYITPLSATVFMGHHWGAELQISFASSIQSVPKSDLLLEYFNNRFGEKYFLENNEYWSKGSNTQNQIIRAGAIYRIEKSKLVIVSKLLFGVSIHNPTAINLNLKEKNSNYVYQYKIAPQNSDIVGVILSPSIQVAKRINRRFLFFGELQYNLARLNYNYMETLTNKYTSEKSVAVYPMKFNYQTIGIGCGLRFEVILLKNQETPSEN